MMPALTADTKAVLLLTAPLLTGRDSPDVALLSPRDYRAVAHRLAELQLRPADLLGPDTADILSEVGPGTDPRRLLQLLQRGFQLSMAVERWRARAIWVVGSGDPDYPQRVAARCGDAAPPVFYGCGEVAGCTAGGLAVVGSRHVDEALLDYAVEIGELAARAARPVVSGGARGVDQAAMRGALEAGGTACGVLADSLERAVTNRENRDWLLDGRLLLLSAVDPQARFNVGNAMGRNKLIYALSDAALVVNSDLERGGTWAGATEQLDRRRCVPVYVRSTGQPSEGLAALRRHGAQPWPNPDSPERLLDLLDSTEATGSPALAASSPDPVQPAAPAAESHLPDEARASVPTAVPRATAPPTPRPAPAAEPSAAEQVMTTVRSTCLKLLRTPRSAAEVADQLDVLRPQAQQWLDRLIAEGLVEKKPRPVRYSLTEQPSLF
ncbi:MAG: DNA-processing protein DprA [Fimbriimonadaceae bacterium]|nr:DNA-processing protein DprA [Fimbriimonadaceae bacterium]